MRSPLSVQIPNSKIRPSAHANASAVWSCTPEIRPRPASRNAVAGLTLATEWIQPLQQRQRHVHGRQEQDQEDRGLHQRARLDRAEAERHARRPAVADEHQQRRQAVQAEQVHAVARDAHARHERHSRHQRQRDRRARQRHERVAERDPAAVLRREHQPPGEAAFEVEREREAGEQAREHRRLAQHEHELEGRVAGRERETRALCPAPTARRRSSRRTPAGRSATGRTGPARRT